MLVSNVFCGVEICITTVPTLPTMEKGLRTTIIAGLIPTARTLLARMPGVYFDHLDATRLRFVGGEAMQLGKAPALYPALPLSFAVGDTLADMRQVLKNQGAARGGVLDEALREDVIVVFSLPKPFPRKFFQVPLSRFASPFLELATEAKNASFLLFPGRIPQELTFAGDSRMGQAQVDPYHFLREINSGGRLRDDDMQEVATPPITQVSRIDGPLTILLGVLRDGETHLLASCDTGKATCPIVHFDPRRAGVIANRRALRLGAMHRLELWWFFALLLRPVWGSGRRASVSR